MNRMRPLLMPGLLGLLVAVGSTAPLPSARANVIGADDRVVVALGSMSPVWPSLSPLGWPPANVSHRAKCRRSVVAPSLNR
jgi:hypothetical protein